MKYEFAGPHSYALLFLLLVVINLLITLQKSTCLSTSCMLKLPLQNDAKALRIKNLCFDAKTMAKNVGLESDWGQDQAWPRPVTACMVCLVEPRRHCSSEISISRPSAFSFNSLLSLCSHFLLCSSVIIFLLLARYVPNVAKRSIWDQCKKNYILRTDRPATSHLGKFQMAISPRGVVWSTSCLVLRWGFRGRRIEWRYFGFRQIQDGGSVAILENSNGDISAADRPIYSVFGSRMRFSGSADRIALIRVWPNSVVMWEKTMREE